MTVRGEAACEISGIPTLHAEAFQEVANRTGYMISTRAVGIYATDLILEGYASKGFHNKAKSCNWGPMAGFVLADPRFTKVGGTVDGVKSQVKALNDAVHEGAKEVPLFISEARRRWLLAKGIISFLERDTDTFWVRASTKGGPSLRFQLKRARPDGARETMWAVRYQLSDRVPAAGRDTVKFAGNWTPVMAMRDPFCSVPANDYRAATTGDYDLFAVWSKSSSYQPDTQDRRASDPHLGNITQRVATLRHTLNDAFRRRGYTGGDMVHHGDEGGRPGVTEVDLPIFAVVPGGAQPYLLESAIDLRQFIAETLEGYAPMLNPGWVTQLVFGSGANATQAERAQHLRQSVIKGPMHRQIVGFDRSNLRPAG